VINVAVTLGSRKERRQERLFELKNACAYLGFELVETADGGLEKISPETRDDDPALWQQSVSRVAEILAAHQPLAIFFPHEADGTERTSAHTFSSAMPCSEWMPLSPATPLRQSSGIR
jgi:LmbE family N-acetylglucosaminyl deacetylase